MIQKIAVVSLISLGFLIPTPASADHDGGYGGGCGYEYDCGGYYDDGYGEDYDNSGRNDYGSYDRNRNRGRNRGAFSPGPFDRSPIEMRDVCISLNCSGREDGSGGEEQP